MKNKVITMLLLTTLITIYRCPSNVEGAELTSGIIKEMYADLESTNVQGRIHENVNQTITNIDGWTTTRVTVRSLPTTESEELGILEFNTYISYEYNDTLPGWLKINYNGQIGYVSNLYVTDTSCPYETITLPETRGFKSWMSYKSITDQTSSQYKISVLSAYTGNYGIRMYSNRYLIAVGTAANAQVGQYIDLILENGTVIPCIVGDIKATKDTRDDNLVTAHNGCCSEFLVDLSVLTSDSKESGDISDCQEDWDSPVKYFFVYEKNCLD